MKKTEDLTTVADFDCTANVSNASSSQDCQDCD